MADLLFLDQTEARRPNKIFLETAAPLYLRLWMIAPSTPYLKIWIRQWSLYAPCDVRELHEVLNIKNMY